MKVYSSFLNILLRINVCPSNLSLKRCQPDQACNWTNLAMINLSTKHITIQSKAIPNFKSFDYIADEDCMPCFMSLIFSPRLQPTVHAYSTACLVCISKLKSGSFCFEIENVQY
ncbi:hypothetical protein POPTR_002G056750v4 [Populus trichocarpa]|uniref:Uncharacterized protein n=1 Tax=Populus trichocarpa TaxID=3694 RepID=A0ACC0TCY5_POPTR|nr:hypothetical protein POPTR_002G056750v4 [Populus trichocarpa]